MEEKVKCNGPYGPLISKTRRWRLPSNMSLFYIFVATNYEDDMFPFLPNLWIFFPVYKIGVESADRTEICNFFLLYESSRPCLFFRMSGTCLTIDMCI